MFLVAPVFPNVISSIDVCVGTLAMFLTVLDLSDVLVSVGVCEGAVTIMENSRRTGRKSKTLSHQKQTSQQNKDAVHAQIIPYIRREIIEAIVCPFIGSSRATGDMPSSPQSCESERGRIDLDALGILNSQTLLSPL